MDGEEFLKLAKLAQLTEEQILACESLSVSSNGSYLTVDVTYKKIVLEESNGKG